MRHIYADFIDQVANPARYLGGEYMSVVKRPDDVDVRMVMAFPDVYEIGMSHLGTKILYSLLNKNPRIAAERAFAPWVDMEQQLRDRDLPLVSLESSTPLGDFDVIGISLQHELTFTNALTLLDLGRVPLRAADRGPGDPLVLGGGSTATHPEPVAAFFDAFYVGEAEQELPGLLLDWAAMRREGRDRADALAELASRYPLYVPSLYDTFADADTGFEVVGAPRDARVPARVRRGVVTDINAYPFPSDTPVPFAEAVFDRAAVEIARGCTEGCRFCQAGMIFRPVRERSPASILDSVLGGVAKAGYDETSLTCLSTADYSSVAALVKNVMAELRQRKVTLSVSSLRAYGLTEDILDEIATMRISGLTFAPEAGTQRMRDVVNKNVGEHHIEESANRVFSRGVKKLKLYFMIGLPTEQDEDVRGIIETGERMLEIGRRHIGKRAELTVSVSSHVPKPHTPFQWCAQDATPEIERKQRLLRSSISRRGLRLKVHDRDGSFLEGVFSRGDRRLGDALELAWKRGARFDNWNELFDPERWSRAFADSGVDAGSYLATRPVTARLPWDHIDVGLEDGFLLREYRKSLADRLSPPCGKVAGSLIHHSNLRDAEADTRKLVCYDCGIACDLSQMRAERLSYLRGLGALEPAPPRARPVSVERSDPRFKQKRSHPRPNPAFPVVDHTMYRLRFTKLGRAAFLGHLDTVRALARLFRRAGIHVAYTRGFHPKPLMQFGPALSLGVPSFGEYIDVGVEGAPDPADLLARVREVASEGNDFLDLWQLPAGAPKLTKLIASYDLLISPVADGIRHDEARLGRIAETFMGLGERLVDRKGKPLDVRCMVEDLAVVDASASGPLCRALGWPEATALLRAQVSCTSNGSAKPIEVAKAVGVWGPDDPRAAHGLVARLGFRDLDAAPWIAASPQRGRAGDSLQRGDRVDVVEEQREVDRRSADDPGGRARAGAMPPDQL